MQNVVKEKFTSGFNFKRLACWHESVFHESVEMEESVCVGAGGRGEREDFGVILQTFW